MTDDTLCISPDALTGFAREVFAAAGVPGPDAATIADVLVWANARGADSHGVLRIPGYIQRIEKGEVNPRASVKIAKDLPAGMIVDGARSFGPVAMKFAAEQAIEKARDAAIGWVLVKDTTHTAAVGYYTLMMAREGMAGLFMGASVPNMAYHGARAAGVATNPIAICVPAADHAPLSLDMATAVAAIGKLAWHRDAGIPLGEGWALTRDGDPTTDPEEGVIPMPLGGPKGAGLALLFECMTSLMVARPILAPQLAGGDRGHRQNAMIAAIDIASFTDLDQYRRDVDALIAAVKALPRAEGVDEILVPGERGDREMEARQRNGIPIPRGTWTRLEKCAAALGVAMPQRLK